MECLEERNTVAKHEISSVAGQQPPGEEVGMVARFQPPTNLAVEQFWTFQATAGTFLSMFWGSFEFLHCTGAGYLILNPGTYKIDHTVPVHSVDIFVDNALDALKWESELEGFPIGTHWQI